MWCCWKGVWNTKIWYQKNWWGSKFPPPNFNIKMTLLMYKWKRFPDPDIQNPTTSKDSKKIYFNFRTAGRLFAPLRITIWANREPSSRTSRNLTIFHEIPGFDDTSRIFCWVFLLSRFRRSAKFSLLSWKYAIHDQNTNWLAQARPTKRKNLWRL